MNTDFYQFAAVSVTAGGGDKTISKMISWNYAFFSNIFDFEKF